MRADNKKEDILSAWIMVELLSEGNIDKRDKNILKLVDIENHDFYTLFKNEIAKKKFREKQQGGIVLYLDIFPFEEVIQFLYSKYGLIKSEEEIQIGDKFSLALYFDKELKFLPDLMFFSASAYIRYKKEISDEKAFRQFEEDRKNTFVQYFGESSLDIDNFNKAILRIMQEYSITIDSCRMQILNDVENDSTNLHSFFIDDLNKAKNISTKNLDAYLSDTHGERFDLNSKSDTKRFRPDLFEKILSPENYPLGRFPSTTKYALSLMQQIAVNLAIGYDNKQMRSVNGPPGTGKTTLLKDIFAELIVEQAWEITKLETTYIKGTDTTCYYEKKTIGEVPAKISDKSIIVASSNNGAVQNIVNEIPLIEAIDERLRENLVKADYFRKIANEKVERKWEKNEEGKAYSFIVEQPFIEEKYWGLFSLEGGKSDNMNYILNCMELVIQYLQEDYEDNVDIYREFEEKYCEVKAKRDAAQRLVKLCNDKKKLNDCRESYVREKYEREIKLKEYVEELNQEIEEKKEKLAEIEINLRNVQEEKRNINEDIEAQKEIYAVFMKEKPGIFSSKVEKENYKQSIQAMNVTLLELSEKMKICTKMLDTFGKNKVSLDKEIKDREYKKKDFQDAFGQWNQSQSEDINRLQYSIDMREMAGEGEGMNTLDMWLSYEELQLSNPWFDEAYRIDQSKLFILALQVRKQFLKDNLKNIEAAKNIWNNAKAYIEKKHFLEIAFQWFNLVIPVISSTFASFGKMCKYLGKNTIGQLFIDEAGQAVPQAAVGAIMRSKNVMVVGDPSQIKPVLALDVSVLALLGKIHNVDEHFVSADASTQTLIDSISQYGFYKDEESWIGIPLWVHRRCRYPMFTISNDISYGGLMVQGIKKNGICDWIDIAGTAVNKYVEEQGEWLKNTIQEMSQKDASIKDKNQKDKIYVITPFKNVAYQLAQKLKTIGFTRYDDKGKPTNVGTIHTFQGKEAPIVFLVLGADKSSSGAARWAVSVPNMMNVAATRAKEEFYIVGDKSLYESIGSNVVKTTLAVIKKYKSNHPEMKPIYEEKPEIKVEEIQEESRMSGTIAYLGRGKSSMYAYVKGNDEQTYIITEKNYLETENAAAVIVKGTTISFTSFVRGNKLYAINIKRKEKEL